MSGHGIEKKKLINGKVKIIQEWKINQLLQNETVKRFVILCHH